MDMENQKAVIYMVKRLDIGKYIIEMEYIILKEN